MVRMRRLAALAIYQFAGPTVFDLLFTGEQLRTAAIKENLYQLDEHHHAPRCPANHFHQKRLPIGRCTCGAIHIR
jgi:hypothetical protein